jgi:thiol-disulfide isomerase/thioredoxin
MSIFDYLSELGPLTSPVSEAPNFTSLNFKYLGLYFTAEWCQACKQTSPTLVDIIKKIEKKSPGTFKIITIRMDG